MLMKKLEDIEESNGSHNSRKFYKGTDWFRKDFKPRLNGCLDKHGKVIGERNDVTKRWSEYFEELLNPQSLQEAENCKVFQTAEIEVTSPTFKEVEDIIDRMRNHKAPGEDGITNELLKHGGRSAKTEIHRLIDLIWKKEEMPNDWKTGLIAPIYKKGNKLECSNYRGVTLLNVAYKIFSSILLSRIAPYTEEILGEYQCGFRKSRGTIDQIFVLRQTMEKCYEFNTDLHLLFIDFKQAFDSVTRKRLLSFMVEKGIPMKLVKLTEMTLSDSRAKVLVDGDLGAEFRVGNGVKQGDSLSATLFNLALHSIVGNIAVSGTIANKSSQVYAYADDIVLIAKNQHLLKEMFTELSEKAKGVGLHVNVNKTKYMIMSANERTRNERNDISIQGYTFEGVDAFIYLGAQVNDKNKISDEIQRRILAGNRAYFANIKLLKSSILSKKCKMRIYKSLIRPVVTYGAETWNLLSSDANKLRVFERKIIRRIWGPINENGHWRIRNNWEINDILENEDIVRFVKATRLRWLGHVQRMTDTRMPKKISETKMEGRRKKGRPRSRWQDEVCADLKALKVTQWKQRALDRTGWKRIVMQAKTHLGL